MTNKPIFRLAFRHEGTMWNCYCADINSMDEAVFLGSIAMSIVAEHRQHKEAFMALMKAAFADFVNSLKGVKIVAWNEPQPAPENERGGHA